MNGMFGDAGQTNQGANPWRRGMTSGQGTFAPAWGAPAALPAHFGDSLGGTGVPASNPQRDAIAQTLMAQTPGVAASPQQDDVRYFGQPQTGPGSDLWAPLEGGMQPLSQPQAEPDAIASPQQDLMARREAQRATAVPPPSYTPPGTTSQELSRSTAPGALAGGGSAMSPIALAPDAMAAQAQQTQARDAARDDQLWAAGGAGK